MNYNKLQSIWKTFVHLDVRNRIKFSKHGDICFDEEIIASVHSNLPIYLKLQDYIVHKNPHDYLNSRSEFDRFLSILDRRIGRGKIVEYALRFDESSLVQKALQLRLEYIDLKKYSHGGINGKEDRTENIG